MPTGTEGYVLNATVVPPTSLGYLQLWQYGQPQPALATVLDALDGAITNNMAVVPDTGGWIDAYASNSTQLVLDISGYFAVPAGGGNVSETITTAPTGITLTIDGANYASPYAFSWVAGSQHTITAPSTAAPSGTPAGTQYLFSGWSDNGAISHTVYAAATTITAEYVPQYYLTTAVSPAGEGTISPGSGWLTAGLAPSISASANSGYQFLGFSGALSGTTSPQSLPPINGPETVTANFALATGPNFSLAITQSPNQIPVGGSGTYIIGITAIDGFSGPISFAASRLPAGASASFNPSPNPAPEFMVVTTSASTPPGTYYLTLAGTSGALNHQVSGIPLVVQAGAPYLGGGTVGTV